MSTTRHADAARDALIAAASTAFAATQQAGKDYATAHKALAAASDVVGTMTATASLILAIEFLQKKVEQAIKDMRFVLAQQMDETGAAKIKTEDGTVMAYLARKPSFVSVDDEQRIPRHFFMQPPPKLDTKAVRDALKSGEVPGCHLSTPNEQSLVIKVATKEWGT